MTSTAQPPVEVEFRATLPYRLTSLLTLVAAAGDYEGFDQRIYVARAELSGGLLDDIERIFLPLGHRLITTRLCEESPAIDEFTAFAAWLARSSAEDVRRAVTGLLGDLADSACEDQRTEADLAAPPVDDADALRAFLNEIPDGWARRIREDDVTFDRTIRLLEDPSELVARLVLLLTRFWDAHGRVLLDACTTTVERSLRYHGGRRYAGTAAAIYRDVTGKRPSLQESRDKLDRATRLLFVPSCYCGAYVTSTCPVGDERTLLVVYNARSSGGHPGGRPEIVRDVFPALRALADETRLQIVLLLRDRELYAQQIVDRLELSQPSISRHLALLVAGGVLSVRRENGMKFYRIHRSSMQRLLERLTALTEKGGSD